MRVLMERNKLEACDLYIGLELVYSEEYTDAWQTAYLEGREDWEDYQNIWKWEGVLIALTTRSGIITVQTKGGNSFKQIHIDNVASPNYSED